MRKQNQINMSGFQASQALDKNFMANAMALDNAYRFTSKMVGRTAYWKSQKRDAFPLVRQKMDRRDVSHCF